MVGNHQPSVGRGREGELVGGGGGGGGGGEGCGGGGPTQHSSPPGAMSFIGIGSKVATLESIRLSRLYQVSSLYGTSANHKQIYDIEITRLEFCNSCVEMTQLEFCISFA